MTGKGKGGIWKGNGKMDEREEEGKGGPHQVSKEINKCILYSRTHVGVDGSNHVEELRKVWSSEMSR